MPKVYAVLMVRAEIHTAPLPGIRMISPAISRHRRFTGSGDYPSERVVSQCDVRAMGRESGLRYGWCVEGSLMQAHKNIAYRVAYETATLELELIQGAMKRMQQLIESQLHSDTALPLPGLFPPIAQ